MKTIYARLGDLQLGDTLEDGTTVGQIGDALGKVGVNIQTANGDLRNMGDVIEELMGKWDQLNTAEQQALAVKLAGKYQYNNLIALLDNAEMYNEQLSAAENSLGTINEQESIYMDSLQGKLNSLQAAFEGFLGSIFNTDEIKPAIDDITGLIKLLTSFTDSVGSTGLFAGIIGTGTRLFSKNIADSVGSMVQNRQARRQKINDSNAGKNLLRDIGEDPSKFQENSATFRAAKMLGSRTNIMNDDQLKRSQTILKQIAAQENDIINNREKSQAIINKMNAAYKTIDSTAKEVKMTEDGQLENFEKAKAAIASVEGSLKQIQTSTNELNLTLTKTLPGINEAIGAFDNASFYRDDKYKKNDYLGRGRAQAMGSLGIISNNEIFKEGSKYQQAFGSMPSFIALQASYRNASSYDNDLAKLKSEERPSDWGEKYQQNLTDLREKLRLFIQDLRIMGEVTLEDVQNVEKFSGASNDLKASLGQVGQGAKDLAKELDFKNLSMSVASIVGDLAQLFGVMQSIKSLGSIIADDSVSGLEKFGQITENLLFTLPMLLSSLSSITTEIGNAKPIIEKFKNGFKEVAEKVGEAGGAAATFGEKISGAFSAIGVGSPQVLIVMAAITTAIMAVSAAIGYEEEKAAQAAEKAEKAYNDSVEKLDKLKSNQEKIDNFNELYEQFKETGVITDDLKASIEELNDVYGLSIETDSLKKDSIDELAKSYENLSSKITDNQIAEAETAQVSLFSKDSGKVKYSENDEDFRLSDFALGSIFGDSVYTQSYLNFSASPRQDRAENPISYYENLWETEKDNPFSLLRSTDGGTGVLGDLMYKDLFDIVLDNEANGYYSEGGFTTKAISNPAEAVAALSSGVSYLTDLQRKIASRLSDGGLSEAQTEALDEAFSQISNLIDQLDSYMSPENRDSYQSLQKTRADAAAQKISNNFVIDTSATDVQNANTLMNELLSQPEIVDYMTMLGEDAGEAYLSGLISSVSNGDFSEVSSKVVADRNKEELSISAANAFQYMYGLSEKDYSSDTNGLSADVNEKAALANADYNSLMLSGLSYKQIEEGFNTASMHGISWDELKAAIEKLTEAGYSMDEAFLLLTDTSSEYMAALADGRDSVLDSIIENKIQQDELDSLVQQQADKINSDRAKTGKAALSSDEALAEAQEELASVLESSLSTQEKITIINKYLSGDIQDLDAAVAEAASGFNSLPGLNQESNTFLQQKYNEILGDSSADTDLSEASVAEMANEYIDKMFSGLTDEMITQISELAPDDFDRLSKVVEALVDMGYEASEAWEYALSGVEDAAAEISPENFEASRQAKGIFGQQRASYYKTTQGYAPGASIINDYNEFKTYTEERGGNWEELVNSGKIDFSQSEDKIKEDIDEIVLNFDSSRDLVNTFRNNLANNLGLIGGSSDRADEIVDSFAEYDDETLQVLDDLGLLKEENLEMLLTLLENADGDKDKLLLMANRFAQIQSGDAGALNAAEDFIKNSSGSTLSKVGKAADLDNNYRNDDAESLWDYASGLGFEESTFKSLAKQATDMGLSTEEFKQWLENLAYGIDSVSEHAKSATEALIEAGRSADEARIMVGSFSQEGLGKMGDAGLFDAGNEQLFNALAGNYNEEQILELIPYLDTDKLDEQIAEINQDPATFYLKAEISNAKDVVNEALSAVENGEEIDGDTLDKLYNIVPTLKDISLYSEQGKQALRDLQDGLDSFETSVLSLERTRLFDQMQDLRASITLENANEVNKQLKDLQDRLDGIDREIDIKIQTNADDVFEELSDQESKIENFKTALREDGGIISAEDFVEISNYYSDIIKYATIAENGKMQITDEGVAHTIEALESEQAADIATANAKLQTQANYYLALADAQDAAAEQYETMAQTQLDTDEDVANYKSQIDSQLNEDETTAAQILADNNASAAESEMQNSSDVANQNNDDNALMVSNTQSALSGISMMYAQWATSAILSANQVATAVSNAAKGQQSSGYASSPGNIGASYIGTPSTAGTSSNTGTYTTPEQKWGKNNYSKLAGEEAGRLRGQADANRDAAQRLLAKIEANNSFLAPGTDSGKGSGSDSGSGSGSGYEPKTKDALDDEADRYEKVNAQIDKLTKSLEQLNTEEGRLVGFNRADMIAKETENIQRQIEVYEEKLKLQKEELKETEDALKGYGVEFDGEGYISNYQEKFNAYLNGINNLIAQYNAATDEETQNALEKQIETAQNGFEDFKDLIEKYDELNSNSIKETEKEIQDLHDKIEDLMLDIFNKAVDAADSIKDVNDKWADFLKATDRRDSDDPILNMEIASKKIANYFDSGTEAANKFYDTAIKRYKELQAKATDPKQKAAYQTLIDNMKAGKAAQGKGSLEAGGSGFLDMILQNAELLIKNVDQYNKTGKSDMFGENQAGMLEAMETVYDQATQAVIDLRSAIDDLQDKIIDAIDNMSNTIEEMDNGFENIYNRFDHMSNMYAYAYGDKAYDKQAQIYSKQLEVQQKQLENSIASRDKLQSVVNSLKEGSKERKEAEEKLQEQEDKIADQTENIAETASNLLNAQANYNVNKWVNGLFGFGGTDDAGTDLDWYATQWELVNKNADYYLDAVNKAYNIQKLQSQYVDLLDNTSALSTQQKITEQMNQQLDYLRNKTNLSEYDVAYAQAQLEILKQQIALEEAQTNKSQMKLRRDSQGNYNYVYTANQDDVKSAQDGLLDAQNNAYNLSKDQMRQTQEDSLSAIQQAKQTLIDIWTDANLTVEQKQARMTFIIDNLKEYLQSTGEQMSESESNIINDFYGMVEALTDTNAEGLADIYDRMKAGSLDAFSEIDGHWGNLMTNVVGYIGNMDDFGKDLVGKMEETVNDYTEKIESAAEKSGVNLKNIEANFDDINTAVEKLEDSCISLQETLTKVATAIGTMGNSLQQYQDQILSITSENSRLGQVIEGLKAQIEQLKMESQAGATESAATGGVNSGKGNGSLGSGSGTGNGGSGSGGDGVPKVGDLATLVWGDYYYDSWGETPNDNVNLGIENGVRIDWRSSSKYGGVNNQTGDFDVHIQGSGLNGSIPYDDLGWVKLSQLKGYDTGGYTGDWSDGSGKLALLHSKEIVLNAADTENILKAVESVRAMTSAMKGVSLAEAVGSIGSIGRSIESSLGTVDQNVNITAEFPNATSADEIKEALLGLNNQVLHYAHRKV